MIEELEEFDLENYKGKKKEEIQKELDYLYKLQELTKNEVNYYNSMQQGLKTALNQLYGSFVNKFFAMYNQVIGASTTAHGRHIIQHTTNKLSDWFHNYFYDDIELHKKMGIKIKKKIDPDLDLCIYIDTDSIDSKSLIDVETLGKISIEDLYSLCEKYDSAGNTKAGHESVNCPYKVLNYTESKKLHFSSVKRLIKHKVTKKRWRLKTSSGKEVLVTNDHSLVIFRNGLQLTVKPFEILSSDFIMTTSSSIDYKLEDIELIEEYGEFTDEYVYDIEVDDYSHTFIANDILVHNSGFLLWSPIIQSTDWTGDPLEFIHNVYNFRLKDYIHELLNEYCKQFNVENLHNFALERINYSGFFLAKKMYIQNVAWEEGTNYKEFDYLYPKGIDLVRRSTPVFVRDKVYAVLKYIFSHPDNYKLTDIQKLLKEIKAQFLLANIEDLSIGCGCSNYEEHVIDDKDTLDVALGSHYSIRAAAYYNFLLNKNKKLENKYSKIKSGDRIKVYYTKNPTSKETEKFGFPMGVYPKEFAPEIDYNIQFEKTVLGPINRFMEAMSLKKFDHRLTINLSLF